MKGILIEPGKEPVVTTLPDSLWAIETGWAPAVR